jgi:hypothetical protein
VLRFYRKYTRAAPDELAASASLSTASTGEPAIAITLCSCGSREKGERLVELVRKFGRPLVDLIRPKSSLKMISLADAAVPNGRCYFERACQLSHLSDAAIETIADFGARLPSPFSHVLIQHVHGAACRVDPAETAFALRDESYVMSIVAAWDGGGVSAAQRPIEWVRACSRAIEPHARLGVYVDFPGDEGEERVRAAGTAIGYGG